MLTAIRDPLYEEFELPTYLHGLLSCWQIQRLRYVRLINVNSLPLSVLGETSRYSHTLGVLRLGMFCLEQNGIHHDDPLAKLLLSALALHDAGTPAFGHSLEYILKQQGGGDHVEAIIRAISGESLTGKYQWSCAPDRSAHSKLRAELKKLLGANYKDAIIETLRGGGPVGHLVSSKTVDLDNVDNVFRMAGALGIRDWASSDPVKIAQSLLINSKDDSLPCKEKGVDSIKRWALIRKKVYEILNLHPLNLSGLAMLREAFETHTEATGDFPASAWWTVDAEVLDSLSKYAGHITDRIKRGDLYPTLYVLWIDTSAEQLRPLEDLNLSLRLFSYRLADELDHRVRVHAVLDRGTFERRIKLFVNDNGDHDAFGTTSRSIIVSVHSQSYSNNHPSKEKIDKVLVGMLADYFNVEVGKVRSSIIHSNLQRGAVTEADRKQISLW